MGYCSPRAPYFGFLDHGCTVYGGIQTRTDCIRPNNMPIPSASYYIPQYNLSNHWRKPFLIPHSIGFPYLIVHGSKLPTDGGGSLPKWAFETHERHLNNRNLLTGCVGNGSGKSIKLWATNEQSSRQKLLEFCLNFEEVNEFPGWNIVMNQDATSNLIKSIDLPCTPYQIKYSNASGNDMIFIRGEKNLYAYNPSDKSFENLFHGEVRSFDVIQYMENEIVVLDYNGSIRHGDRTRTSSFTEVKGESNIKTLAVSDHPRIIYIGDEEAVWALDIRTGSFQGNQLYKVRNFDDSSSFSLQYNYSHFFANPKVHHIGTLNGMPRMLFVVSSDKFTLVDERMRGLPYLEAAHSIHNGGNYILSAPSLLDQENQGKIFPIYILGHTVKPDVQSIAFYEHFNGHWSTLNSFKALNEPNEFIEFYRQQPKYGIKITKAEEMRYFRMGITRSIHTQCLGDYFLLFRTTNDGSIWYESISISNDFDKTEMAIESSFQHLINKIEEIQHSRSVITEEESEDMNTLTHTYDIAKNLEGTSINTSTNFYEDPLCMQNDEGHYPQPVLANNYNNDHLLSQIVAECWKKYSSSQS